MRLFIESESKRALRKLSDIKVITPGCESQTPFETLYMHVKNQITKPKILKHYLAAMKSSNLCSENMLKFCVLVHIVVQKDEEKIEEETLQAFLTELLQLIPKMIEKYEVNQFKRDKSIEKSNSRSISATRPSSCTQSPANSARSESLFVCKQVYLLTHVVRPYIGYLLKFIFGQSELKTVKERKDGIRGHQAWMIVNFLKSAASVSNGFTFIGRYFLKSYGHLVVLLTKALARDINTMMPLLASFVSKENNRLIGNKELPLGAVQEFVRLLEEISMLNQQLYPLFLGKYFIKYLLDLPQPKWVFTNSKQFDAVYNFLKMQLPNSSRKSVKKRSKSVIGLTQGKLSQK